MNHLPSCPSRLQKQGLCLAAAALFSLAASSAHAAEFDAVPFGLPLPDADGAPGVLWEDPRELHRVVVHFSGTAPQPDTVQLQYWGSRWPEQHLPKDKQPGGGSVGWMELGNWYNGGWRTADAEATAQGASAIAFTFRPVNAKEFPKVKGYDASFRYTLKIRVKTSDPQAKVSKIEAFTDSRLESARFRLAFGSAGGRPGLNVFNGSSPRIEKKETGSVFIGSVDKVVNSDPNTFDRTLVTVTRGKSQFTFAIDDLQDGPLFMPQFGAAVLPENDARDYAALAQAQKPLQGTGLYDRVAKMPEQTWQSAWDGMPRKKTRIYYPLGLDGGRQRFKLSADGSLAWRSNDHYLRARPGKDTPRLGLEPENVRLDFGISSQPVERHLDEEGLPVCSTTWEEKGFRITQTAYVTELTGTHGDAPVPEADAFAVFMGQFTISNTSSGRATAALPIRYHGNDSAALSLGDEGFVLLGKNVRAQFLSDSKPTSENRQLSWTWDLAPGETRTVTLKIPYVLLTSDAEKQQLAALDFETERLAADSYWRRRMNEASRLVTPESVLNDFYRAQTSHLLINCEREPNATRRFARVGSFAYGAYGNESCMMVVDLDRRGLHREAQECLDAWLHYQGTVKLPGDFDSKQGILYGAGGYEAGGYNQHHGWILWCMAEHYRFTRDSQWLTSAAPGILAGADWIIRETSRTASRHPLERGLLPAGSLEDIGDWWTWLSTSCYTWRGLDSAAWALEQLKHPEAARVRKEADAFHKNLLANFRAAAARSPVVRLRDGVSVPHIPSYVHRRGRSFGWICETLEGAIHLIITGAIDPRSPEAESIIRDYEDNLYLSNQYGYTLQDFDKYWFGRGGMSMQACLLLDVEPYLYRDDVKHALRATFNSIAVSHFPDVHMNTEHALPNMEDWTGDHFKSSDESNACGWLRYLIVRESSNQLLLGQAIPRDWLKPGQRCGIDRAATYFGPVSVLYTAREKEITARLSGPARNPPETLRVRFRAPGEAIPKSVTVNGKPWNNVQSDWVLLPGNMGNVEVIARY